MQYRQDYYIKETKHIIIQSKFFFFFIGRELTTWPASNCLQIMICSCAMPSNCVWLQIIFCSCVKETVLFFFLRSLFLENGKLLRFPRIFIKKQTRWSNDKAVIELIIAKYRDLSASRRSIICLSLQLRQLLICSPQTNHDILHNLVQ